MATSQITGTLNNLQDIEPFMGSCGKCHYNNLSFQIHYRVRKCDRAEKT